VSVIVHLCIQATRCNRYFVGHHDVPWRHHFLVAAAAATRPIAVNSVDVQLLAGRLSSLVIADGESRRTDATDLITAQVIKLPQINGWLPSVHGEQTLRFIHELGRFLPHDAYAQRIMRKTWCVPTVSQSLRPLVGIPPTSNARPDSIYVDAAE